MRKSLVLLECFCMSLLFAGENILFKSDFANSKNLADWFGAGNSYVQGVPVKKPEKAPDNAAVIEKDGEAFLQVQKGFFGVTYPFPKPVKVNDALKRVSVKVVFRQATDGMSSIKEIALTSRRQPSGDKGNAFWMGRDSGIAVRGYMYSNQGANVMYWRKEGMDYMKYKSCAPYNMFPKTVHSQWTTASILFDNEAKTASFSCDGGKAFVLRNIDLQGAELNALYLCSFIEVKNVEVSCVTE